MSDQSQWQQRVDVLRAVSVALAGQDFGPDDLVLASEWAYTGSTDAVLQSAKDRMQVYHPPVVRPSNDAARWRPEAEGEAS